MGMQVNTNLDAINAQRNLYATSTALSKSVERLSSGLRVNRAADDAAGLSISEKLRNQIKGTNQAVRNAQDGISMIQTAEGAMNEVHSMLQRMGELATQAANDTLSTDDRKAINDELTSLKAEVDGIAARTKFNGKSLLTGSISSSLDAASGTKVGEAAGTALVSQIDVSKAAADTAFTFGGTAGGAALTMTATIGGASVTQTVTVAAMGANETQVLDFSQFGVKLTLVNGDAAETAANIADGLRTAANVTTAAGSGSANFQIGASAADTMSATFSEVKITGAAAGKMADLGTALTAFDAAVTADSGIVGAAQNLMSAVTDAIGYVSEKRSSLGAAQNRLEHAVSNLQVMGENLSASESRIRDADMAAEMVGFTKNQVLQQAGTAILAQANQLPQGVLSLLR